MLISAPGLNLPGGAQSKTKTEKLDPQVIEGLLCNGMRMTMTLPAGAIGNDRDIVSTTETWSSQELGVMVSRKSSDLRMGDVVTRLTNISRAEPNPSLFVVPADYTIQDQPTFGAPKP